MAGARRVCTVRRESMWRLMPLQPSCTERRVERSRKRRTGSEVKGTLIMEWIEQYVNIHCIPSSLSPLRVLLSLLCRITSCYKIWTTAEVTNAKAILSQLTGPPQCSTYACPDTRRYIGVAICEEHAYQGRVLGFSLMALPGIFIGSSPGALYTSYSRYKQTCLFK